MCRSHNGQLSCLCIFGKTLSALSCKGLCSPRLCTNHLIWSHVIPPAGSSDHQTGGQLPVSHLLQDYCRGRFIPDDSNRSPHLRQYLLCLPFMQGTGMILDLVDNLAECKYLHCLPFRLISVRQIMYLSQTNRVLKFNLPGHTGM